MKPASAWLSVLACLLLVGGLARGEDTIVLGTSLSITGKYASNGKAARDGYMLAVKRINEKGGVKVGDKTYQLKFVYEDDTSNPEKGAQIFEKLVAKDGVRFTLGPYGSPVTATTSVVADKHGALMVNCCGGDRALFERGLKGFFGVLSMGDQYLSPAIDLLATAAQSAGKDTKQLRIAVAVEPEIFSRSIREGALATARRYGMQVVLSEELPKDLSDMKPILEKVKQLKPDLLIVSGHDKGAITAAREIAEMQVDVPMIAMTHCDSSRLVEHFGEKADYFVCSSQWDESLPFHDPWFGTAKDFADRFEQEYRYKASYISAQSAASVLVYANAIDHAGSLDVEKVRAALASTDLRTFFGVVRFDEHGMNPARTIILFQVQKGQLKIVYPSQWAESQLIYPAPPWASR